MGVNTLTYILTFILGFILASSVTFVFALSLSEKQLIETEQNAYFQRTGTYFQDKGTEVKVHTYKGICEGYVIEEETPTQIISTGYGLLADDYTYVYEKPSEGVASTTDTGTSTVKGDF